MHVWKKYLSVADNAASPYHRLSRQELINLFSSPRKMVIEIGSSGGYAGKYCKEKFPGVTYWGFELNQGAARESLQNLDKVVCGKFEEQNLEVLGLKPNSVDGVVLGDVLEHMYDPWRVLTALLPWLTPDAELVISLPNVRNLWLMNEIAEGRFTYTPDNLLDITHIRFFTLREIHSMLDSTGYSITPGGVNLDERLVDYFNQHKHLRGPCVLQYQSLAIRATGEEVAELCAKQFIFRAQPKKGIKDALAPVAEAGIQNLIHDYDESFNPDPVHHVATLPPRPDRDPVATRLFAFYLPQFHPTAQNSEWWGDGFTEWTNVTRARPTFAGQYQPRHPGELGYYDLRVPEVMARQVALAKQAGLAGFVFYYYWFSGERMLEKPLHDYMARYAELQLPFFVMWCNENWRKTWVDKDQHEHDLLMEHKHRPDDPEKFIEDLAPVFAHEGYFRMDGKPVLLVYPLVGNEGTLDVAGAKEMVRRWREHARKLGLGDLLIGGLERASFTVEGRHLTAADVGVDFFFEFPPNNSYIFNPSNSFSSAHAFFEPDNDIGVFRYQTFADAAMVAPTAKPTVKTVMAGSWDNTARKGNRAHIFHGCTPESYETWLRNAVAYAADNPAVGAESMVFINAWNEWAEGVYLEPDRKYGYALLAATQRVAFGSSGA